jgi:tRNA pseudouridine13 synthase
MIIRRTPHDFTVVELLTPAAAAAIAPSPSTDHRFAAYELEKSALTTSEAVGRLARKLRVQSRAFSHCGLKDKHAVTRQVVTVECSTKSTPQELPTTISAPGIAARRLGFAPAAASARWIARNRFTIVLRDVSLAESRALDVRASQLLIPDSPADGRDHADRSDRPRPAIAIINYFGEQRFGSARHGDGFAGANLVAGDFEGALRLLIGTPARKDSGARRELTRACAQQWGSWQSIVAAAPRCPERAAIEVLASGGSFRAAFSALPYLVQELALDAFQSLIWNQIVNQLLATLAPGGAPGPHDFTLESPAGRLASPSAAELAPWLDASGRGTGALSAVDLPSPGAAWSGPAEQAAQHVLAEHGLSARSFDIPGLRRPRFASGSREVLVLAERFDLGPMLDDELTTRSPRSVGGPWGKRIAEFDLPSGSYATIVLRSLGQT